MAQPPATNIHYRNNTSTTNQPPQLLTNIRSTQIAAKKKKKPTTKERQSERWIERRGKRVRSMATSEWDHLPNPNLSPAKPTFKLTPPSTTFNHQIHQPLAVIQTHLPPSMNLTLRLPRPISTKSRLPFLLSWPSPPPPSFCSRPIVRRGRTQVGNLGERERDSKKGERKVE